MRSTNLILHAGASAVERGQVIDTPTPANTRTWFPIPHGELLGQVERSLNASGLHVVNEAHGLTKDGNRYFGLLQVANGSQSDNFGLVVGVRNSHDQSFPAALVLGSSVFVCDNLSFSGQVKLARKHTRYILRDLPQIVERAVGRLGGLRLDQEQRYLSYQRTELAEVQAHDLLIRAVDAGVVPVTKLPDVLQEWREPRHPEFKEGRTAWRLFNGFTEILKGNLDLLPKRTEALHGLLDSACGLVIEGKLAAEPETIQAI